MSFEQSLSPYGKKLLGVGLSIVLGATVTGYFAGTRSAPSPWPMSAPPSPRTVGTTAEALPPTTYLGRRARRHGPSSEVTSPLDGFRAGVPDYGDPVRTSPTLHARAVAARTERRAFDGAPPVVPHPIDEQSAHSCRACHQQPLRIEGHRVPVMSHPSLANCTACHVPVAPRVFGEAPLHRSEFAGRESPGLGDRAFADAPPTIPHTIHMRETCAACHGLGGPEGLRTTHPERLECRQCHAASTTDLPWHR